MYDPKFFFCQNCHGTLNGNQIILLSRITCLAVVYFTQLLIVGYNHLISNKGEWNNCFIKNNQVVLLDLVNFAFTKTTRRQFYGRCFFGMV